MILDNVHQDLPFFFMFQLSDCTKFGDCLNSENHIFLNLQSRGLKGGGKINSCLFTYMLGDCEKF